MLISLHLGGTTCGKCRGGAYVGFQMKTTFIFISLLAVGAMACSSSSSGPTTTPAKTDAEWRNDIVTGMHDTFAVELKTFHDAAVKMQADAPTPAGRGWDATMDAAALSQLRDDWRACRVAYEHIEGAIAPLFPATDNAVDARYDDFLTQLAGAGDADPFDAKGVTGMHAIERIIFSDTIQARVVDFEKTLPGYAKAAFPSTADQATEFKTKLLQKLVDDIAKLQAEWLPAAIDIGTAFQGLIALMNEQREKVNKAATGEEESRYAQTTLFDLRNNLDGTATAYELFRPWLRSKTNTDLTKDGPTTDAALAKELQALRDLYKGYTGDAVPQPPETWSSDAPTAADLATPFGKLWSSVHAAVDPTKPGSVVSDMNTVAKVLGFPQFVE